MEQIRFTDTQTDSEEWFYVLEQTTIGGDTFLLVTDEDPEDEDALAYILRAITEDNGDITYEEVTDQKTLSVVSKVFDELLEDISLQ